MAINETAGAIAQNVSGIMQVGVYVLGGAAGLYIISIVIDFLRMRRLEKTVNSM